MGRRARIANDTVIYTQPIPNNHLFPIWCLVRLSAIEKSRIRVRRSDCALFSLDALIVTHQSAINRLIGSSAGRVIDIREAVSALSSDIRKIIDNPATRDVSPPAVPVPKGLGHGPIMERLFIELL
jgi:hypothetical protein